jgi:broad specificity phosphatase PhoE
MERAILARHGESVFSVRGLMNGDPSVAGPLTEQGRAEARALGDALRGGHLDLCITSTLERAVETADLAVGDRDVPRLELPELSDPRYGEYEGRTLDDYRAWAHSARSEAEAPGGGESRQAIIRRYATAYRTVLERPEHDVLVVCHSLPIAYAINARAGDSPSTRVPLVPYATPFPFAAAEIEKVVEVLEAWLAAPSW